jgi:hypothetical protein
MVSRVLVSFITGLAERTRAANTPTSRYGKKALAMTLFEATGANLLRKFSHGVWSRAKPTSVTTLLAEGSSLTNSAEGAV